MAAVDYDKNAQQEFLTDEYSISQENRQKLFKTYEALKNGTLKTRPLSETKAYFDEKYGK